MNTIKQKYLSLSRNERIAFWLIAAVALAMAAFSFLSFEGFLRYSNPLRKITHGLPLALALVALAGARLVLWRRPVLGAAVFIGGFTLQMLLIPLVLTDLAFQAAVLAFVVGTYLSTLVLPRQNRYWAAVISGAAAVLILMLEVFTDQLSPLLRAREVIGAEGLWLAWILTGFIGVIYAYFLVRQYPSFSLRSKIIVILLVLTIAPTAAVGLVANRNAEVTLTRNANDALTGTARQVATSLDFFIATNLEAIRAEAQYPDFAALLQMTALERAISPVSKNALTTLTALALKSRFISSYALLDKNGIDIADTDEREIGQDKSDRAYFRAVLETEKPYVSSFGYSALENQPSIYFAAPVRNGMNEIVGVLRLRYDAGIVQDLIARQGIFEPEGLFGMVVTDSNILLADSHLPEAVYQSIVPLDAAAVQEMQSRRLLPESATPENAAVDLTALAQGLSQYPAVRTFSGEFHSRLLEHRGNTERVGVARLANAPWYVVAGQSEEVLFAPVRNQARGALLMVLIASLLAIGFGFLVAWFLAAPLTRLSAAASQLAAGNLAARAQVKTQDEVGALADAFNGMAEQLAGLVETLEQRVADRTRALAASAEVSRRLSTILDADELVKAVIEELQRTFHYYHVHIYLFDEQGRDLVMMAGSGEAGRLMRERGHKIPRGRGLVGRAAETGAAVLVQDVSQSPEWLPNPLLPETKAEIAVPIAAGAQVWGVLDVQQDRVDGLRQEDADLLQAIANQVAVALQNARRYAEAERQASREALISAIGQRIQMADSVEEALEVAVRETSQALGKQVDILVNGQSTDPISVIGKENLPPPDVELITAVSQQLAAHLENLRLYTSAQRELEERRHTEEQLETQRRNLQAVLDNMAAGVYMVEVPSGRPILANRKAEELLGRGIAPDAAGEELNQVYPAYRYGTDIPYPTQELPVTAGMYGVSAHIDDLEIRQPDGQRLLLDVTGSPVVDGEGNVVASVVVLQDITLRRQVEDLIAKRAAQLATVSEVATVIATIADPDEMLQTVVDMTKASFGLYHAHVYLLNEAGDTLVLSKGAGDIGRQMVLEGRQIRLDSGKSIVARAARTREGVIVNDVRSDPEFLPHPLLPNTRAEMAVPLMVGDRLLGVLDVQSDRVGHFDEEDILTETTLAAQVAVALQNARQHAATRTSEELVRTVINSTPDWIFIKDLNHRYRLVNQGYANALQLQPEDFIGKDDLDLGFPEELVKGNPARGIRGFWADDRLVIETNQPHHFPDDLATIDGKVHIFDTYKTPLRDAHGNPLGVLAFARDVTNLQTLLQQNQTLYEGSRQLSRCATFEDVIRVLAEHTLLRQFSNASINLFDRPWDKTIPGTVRVAAVWERDPGSAIFQSGVTLPLHALPGVETLAQSPTIVSGDVQALDFLNPASREFFAANGIHALVVFKIIVSGEFVGMIQGVSMEKLDFTEEETRTFLSLAEQAVTVIQNLRLFEQVQEALEETAGLYAANRRLIEAQDLNEMLQAVLEAFNVPALNRAALFLFEYDDDDQLAGMVVRENYCASGEMPSFPTGLRFAEAQARQFFEQMQGYAPVFLDETDENARMNRIHSAVILPLWIGSRPLGVIALHAAQAHHFSDEEKRISAPLAQQAAVAVQNRLLFEETLASETRFRITSEQLSQALAIARMGYFEYDPASQMLTLNDQILAVLERSVEETGGYTLSAERFSELFLFPEDHNLLSDILAHAMQPDGEQAAVTLEHPFRRRDGSRGYLATRVRAVVGAQGQVERITGATQDITEARRAQETIAKRAAELATVAEVSTAVSTIQDPNEMLQTVVDLTRQAFDLYHAHIYLVDESGDALILAKGAGEVGRRMAAEGRRIALNAGQSLVARAARVRHGVIANDVSQEPGFLPHPLLPDTRSEMAIPMIVGGIVLGVMDIQDHRVGRFTLEDINIMTTLATQVAVALQNARSYARAQRQAEREALINAINERIQATDSIESALQVAVREIGRALGAPHTVVRLGVERKDELK